MNLQKVAWFLFALWCQVVATSAQDSKPFREVAAGDEFHEAILKAAKSRISTATDKTAARNDYWKIRRAMLLPKVREYVKEMVLMQVRIEVANGADNAAVPLVDGQVNVADIDWEALLAFLEKLIPLIITLIGLFGFVFSGRLFYLFTKGGA